MENPSDGCRERAFFYSPLSFLRRRRDPLTDVFLQTLGKSERDDDIRCVGDQASLFVRELEWDTKYFDCPTFKIEFTDWPTDCGDPAGTLTQALAEYRTELARRHRRYYLFAEVPSEDLVTLQAMGSAGLRLIETRLTYYRGDVQDFSWPRRFAVRNAAESDIANLRRIAAQTRNRYDRFHADPFYSQEVADEFLATFVESSIKGFADVVLVPDEGADAPDAFLTANVTPGFDTAAGTATARMVLSAVGEARKGWYLRLLTEMNFWLQAKGVRLVYMSTQSTNRAVIRVWEKIGYEYGRATHILAVNG